MKTIANEDGQPEMKDNVAQADNDSWERSLDSYFGEDLDILYAEYADEAQQLVEVGLAEYAQHLRQLDKL